MKLKFDSNLHFQEQAIQAVLHLFNGQQNIQHTFTMTNTTEKRGKLYSENGIGNKLEIDVDTLQKNLHEVQLQNALPQTALSKFGLNFSVEMETGTGKTYVFLRTILELNKQYGFSKFIIVVPSVAIKVGVYKSLQITKEHFKTLYDNIIYDYFIYDSSRLEQIRSFAISENIQIMVITIDAFKKSFENQTKNSDDQTKYTKANVIHRPHNKLNDARPIELIQATNPIVIIDEPQTVDSTEKSKIALALLNPLCTLRYSATHTEKFNPIYKLNAIDAFELELVKQIEVASIESKNDHNTPYMKLLSVDNSKSPIKAKLELDCEEDSTIKRKRVTVKKGDELQKITKRALYTGYYIHEIWCEKGNEYLDFTAKPEILTLNTPIGDIDPLLIKEQQIRKTIEEHLNKELTLTLKHDVKVLSLFFIDKVANYRCYDTNGNVTKGVYATLFEKHYNELIQQGKYKALREKLPHADVSAIHNGYFSQDPKGKLKDTSGTTNDDNNAYNEIMKDKEKLLSFNSSLRFIFSHSALREGWDNPNVFQICTLNDTNSEMKKRQEIGRGLRLCVNQQGERLHGFSINTLTVMANESYESFVSKLQKEYEDEQGIKFNVLEPHNFASIVTSINDGENKYLGQEASIKLYTHFLNENYINSTGKIQDSLKRAIKDNTLALPPEFEENRIDIQAIIRKACGNLNIKPAGTRTPVMLNKERFLDQNFKELWNRIKYKTFYSVEYNSTDLIKNCVQELKKQLDIQTSKLIFTKATANVNKSGISVTENDRYAITNIENEVKLPDIITYLQNETALTRKTLVEILQTSDTLNMFKINPQTYMFETSRIIANEMRFMLTDGIKYTKIGEDVYYAQELFEKEELYGYLESNMLASTRSIYEYIVCDSENEKYFAEKFENNDKIKSYVKLPSWFKVPTPIGTYNPDWAVLIEKDTELKLYFVIETKADVNNLRTSERKKAECGQKSFDALDEVRFKILDKKEKNFENFIENI